jgi:hypothetical protein
MLTSFFIVLITQQLASSTPMWSSVVQQLEKRKQLGIAIPIRCNNHPSQVTWIQSPGQIQLVTPDGELESSPLSYEIDGVHLIDVSTLPSPLPFSSIFLVL